MREVTLTEFLLFLKDFIVYCLKGWRVFFFVLIVICIIFLLHHFFNPPDYVASAIFIKQYPTLRVRNNALAVNTVKEPTFSSLFDTDNITELFKSKDFIESCLIQPAEWLGANKTLLDGYWDGDWSRSSFLSGELESVNQTDAIEAALRITSKRIIDENLIAVREDKNLDYYTLSVSHESEHFATVFCRMLLRSAIRLHDQLQTKKVTFNLQMIQAKVDSLQLIVSKSIVSSATSADLLINSVRQIAKAGLEKKEIEARVNADLYDEMTKQLELARINSFAGGPIIKAIDIPRLPLKKEHRSFFEILNSGLFLLLSFFIVRFTHRWSNSPIFDN